MSFFYKGGAVKHFFVCFVFLSLGLICAMQRCALQELQRTNATLRQYAAGTFVATALAEVNAQSEFAADGIPMFLSEPADYTQRDVIARIDMLQAHYPAATYEYPAPEWVNAVLSAAKDAIVHKSRSAQPDDKLGACPYIGAAR
jgi:hypothetical protein